MLWLTVVPALLGLGRDAVAQTESQRFELTPYGGYRFGGSFKTEDGATTVSLDDSHSLGLVFNARESANTQWEVIYSRQDSSADTSMLQGFAPTTDMRIELLQGGGTYEFEGTAAAQPYLAATLGGTHVSPEAPGLDSDTFWSMSIGLGLALRPNARFGVRLEARALGTLVGSSTTLFCRSDLGGGCTVRLDGRVLWQVETFAGVVFRF